MDAAFWRELPAALAELDREGRVRAIVLSGRGPHFSAGIDLAMLRDMAPDPKADPARTREALRRRILELQQSFSALERCRKPVIAAIHGACLGAAMDLVTACDLRIAADDARFAIHEINIGMVADVGTLQRAPHLLPHGILRELAYTGREMRAAEAAHYGFVNAVAPSREDAIARAVEIARTIAGKSPLAVAGTKQVLNHAREHTVADGLDYVATWNAGMLLGEDLMKGAAAALTKSEPDYEDLGD
ncbi:MAG: crotonase/enoyl-CoA hydratase family protein [Alphaproteobacteria bacterium]|nr:MAG: crotonase/enoyl-CoA hydratase family protein [Alphaproteobacteria bacterium]